MTTIAHTGDPYPVARTIDRALEGYGWRVVVMHAEAGAAIRICPKGRDLFQPETLVLVAGEQLVITDDRLDIMPIPEGGAA